MTEVPTIVTIEPLGGPPIPGSSGQPLPHLVVEVRGDDGQVLPLGRTGEITVRGQREGPWTGLYRPMLGYHGHADATTETVRDAVLYTGDIGEVDQAGNLFVRDRRRALILRGGANIYPAEVERVVAEVPGVLGVAVVGVADERLGQRVAAAVELAPGAAVTAADLDARCRANLARYKIPEQWRFVELPRNAMGKIARAELEHLFE
jgi:acyl-CoA synthetase (AMP-forming)/AMP-acid ligase II